MRRIQKTLHEIKGGPQRVRLPMKALPKVVMWDAHLNVRQPSIWWDILNTSGVLANFQVHVIGPGEPIDRDLIYIGTLRDDASRNGSSVWHFFFRMTHIDYSETKLKDIPTAGDPL